MTQRRRTAAVDEAASSRGRFVNTGTGPTFQPLDIGHKHYCAVVEPDTAFWALVPRERLWEPLADGPLLNGYRKKAASFAREMTTLRSGLKPITVYFNPTARCNLNCRYCYIPERLRRAGPQMTKEQLLLALKRLHAYFRRTLPAGRTPSIIFHGSEPLLNRDAMFAAIAEFGKDFRFGIQTNATLLDAEAVEFLTARNVGIGISLDGAGAAVADRARKNWAGEGSFAKAVESLALLKGYAWFNVICTVTTQNVRHLTGIVEFLHGHEVPACMLNPLRCTLPRSRSLKPGDHEIARHFLAALDRSYELYRSTGRKLVVANFANTLLSILAPSARRLMCDLSPCGAGRCFFAVGAEGDMFPCSEFIGVPRFRGGNLFTDRIETVLRSEPFRAVAARKAESIAPCARCAIRHFCGSPCPAEAHEMRGDLNRPGAFCELYEEQVRYAFRLIADGKQDAFLWDDWDRDTRTVFDAAMLEGR